MEEMTSLWSYQESIEELKQKLLYTTLELEQLKVDSTEELRKSKKDVKHLIQLLRVTIQERDEARDQLQKILNKIVSPTPPTEYFITPQSILVRPTKANSSITESNSLSDTYNNYPSHGSSPVESFFDAVSSPELSNMNMADSCNVAFMNPTLVPDSNGTVPNSLGNSLVPKLDQATLVIDNMVKGKSLPQKGRLLQAVLEAGPLLQTLLVAGPLPRWRNPPQLQPFSIPPVSIKGCETEITPQKPMANLSHAASRSLNNQPYVEMSCASSQLLSTSMLNFTNGTNTNSFVPTGKRQRFY